MKKKSVKVAKMAFKTPLPVKDKPDPNKLLRQELEELARQCNSAEQECKMEVNPSQRQVNIFMLKGMRMLANALMSRLPDA